MSTHMSYEVVTDTVTVVADTTGDLQTFTLTAPTGKKPAAGGFNEPTSGHHPFLFGSYPDGQNWVFRFLGSTVNVDVALYLVCADL